MDVCECYQGIKFQEDVHEQGLAGEAAQHVPDKSESKSAVYAQGSRGCLESIDVRVSQRM